MPRAVRFHHFGGIDVLQVEEVPRPIPAPGTVLVRVRAAGINPGEALIRQGAFAERWPATFPSGQGSDLAGVVETVGEGVTAFRAGQEVFGFTDDRASHAEYVVVPEGQLVLRPAGVPWEVAGALFVAGTTAYAAVEAVNLGPGDTVAISGATGGVGTLAVQLARLKGARVIGIASASRREWLQQHGATVLAYGNDLAGRLRNASGGRLDAFIDTFGQGYVQLAIELGVNPQRIDTIIDFDAARKYGVKTEGRAAAARAEVITELARLVATGQLVVPVARTYPLAQVQDAFRELEQRHTLGKIVLIP
jgi:NADPH:quinone reductase-like Zn-dependent oxidoreductase